MRRFILNINLRSIFSMIVLLCWNIKVLNYKADAANIEYTQKINRKNLL